METYSQPELNSDFKKEQRVERALEAVIKWYKLPETFTNDTINRSLLQGACEKLINSKDPLYQKRVKNFIRTLVSNHSEAKRFSVDINQESVVGRGMITSEEQERYLHTIADKDATREFQLKYSDKIQNAIAVWKSMGFDLEVETIVVDEDVYVFQEKTGGAAFVEVPTEEELKTNKKQKVVFAVIKGVSDSEYYVNHELYHLIDYFDFIRRGKGGFILESLDELHTEYMAGNYYEGVENMGRYENIKDFWNKLCFLADVDFNLIKDRKNAIKEISDKFGFEGLISFSMVGAQPSGSKKTFETFINNNQRAIIEMLIAKEKNSIKHDAKNITLSIENINNSLIELKNLLSPKEGDISPEFKSINDLILSKNKKLFVHNGFVSPEKAKELINNYCKACAFLELYKNNEISKNNHNYDLILESINQIPFKRKNPEFNLEQDILRKLADIEKYESLEKDAALEKVSRKLFFDLNFEFGNIIFAFSLQNPDLKNNILSSYLIELDKIASFCINHKNPNVKNWFAEGFKSYNIPFEIVEFSIEYLKNKYPELKIN